MSTNDFERLLKRYIIGVILALLLSVVAYFVATGNLVSSGITMGILLLLAIIQLVVQLIYFLHLNVKDRSVLRTGTLAFTLLMMMVIVTGSIWIMKNLDYNMGMSSEAMTEYMKEQNKKGF